MTSDNSPDAGGLSAERLELLTYLLEEEGIEPPQTQTIAPRGNVNELPLSFAQQRLWFLAQLEPESSIYNIPAAYRLSGPLNVTALEQSLSEIVRRHETLRTTFYAVEGQPFQLVTPHQPRALPVVDLRGLPDREKDARAMQLATEDAHRPFDLAQGSLCRATLVRLTEEEYVFLLNTHHIVSDGWSAGVFFQELATLYEAFSTGKPSPLPELPVQYADFAVWQRQWLQGQVLEAQLTYWKQQLRDIPDVLELPTARPRPAVQTNRGAKQTFELSRELTQALEDFSRRLEVTPFMTLLAAFKVILHRYSGQDDIVVGTPIANRHRVEIEGLIGLFANTLILRTDLSGDPTVGQLLNRVREFALPAYDYQDLPFERLVEELNPPRSLSYHPVFQVLFVLQNTPQQPPELKGLTIEPLRVERETALVDLVLSIRERDGCLQGSLSYSSDLFDATAIGRMAGHFRTVISGMIADPNRPISMLPLLTETERSQLLVEWNATQEDYPKDTCIHELFEAQAARTPDAIAVVDDVEWTYRELNTRANQLAHYLRRHGVGPEVLVAVCMERGLEMLVSLLGILKAGGAYLPLDIDYPPERLAFMLEDSRPPVLLAQQSLLGRLPSHGAQVICVDSDWGLIAHESEQNPPASATAGSAAYVFYTSGSTGKPKGVQGYHRGVVNLCKAMASQFGLHAQDRVMQFSSLCFDIAVEEIFPTWMSGATLVLRTETSLPSIPAFLEAIRRRRITVLDLPTAFWHTLVDVLEMSIDPLPETLRLVVVGGEKASAKAFAKWLKVGGERIRWLNTYGPTETTVTATVHEPARASGMYAIGGEIPIGRPIANTQVYVLDPLLQPVPIGLPGELYIGGVGVTRGYLNRPEPTAERFIPDPFSGEPGARLYKTGDLARHRPDGNLEFLGRLDHQVKLRGFRIELGEIEAVLGGYPAVQEAVVLAREDLPGEKRLAAYVVPAPARAPSTTELRTFLQAKLPEYMVPTAFVYLDALPLTPNGKLDRQALPAPDLARPALDDAFVAPRTPVEEKVVEIWAQVLGVEQVGIHDNFFELGGHSLLATRVMSRLRDTFHMELPLRSLFEAPTVAGLGLAVAQCQAERAEHEEMAHLLAELEGLPDEEARRLLADGRE
jgi:amino acid adenylation domain-containing protein